MPPPECGGSARSGRMRDTTRPGCSRASRRLAVVVAVLIAALALGELLARACSDPPLPGIGPELFVSDRFGSSRGNASGQETTVFGERVVLDADGFRVPEPGYRSNAARALLVVGDSVAFGPGVPEPETVAGRLRREFPAWNVL